MLLIVNESILPEVLPLLFDKMQFPSMQLPTCSRVELNQQVSKLGNNLTPET